MENIQLIKDILANKVTDYTLDDIFHEDDLEYGVDLGDMFLLDDLDLSDHLDDEILRSDNLLDDNEKITDEMRIKHGLYYLNVAIEKRWDRDIICEDIEMYKSIQIDGADIYIGYSVNVENHGMGLSINYDDARLVGVFDSYDKLMQHYQRKGYYFLDEVKCTEESSKYILESWDKDSIETETPFEIETRLVKDRLLIPFKVYTSPISIVKIGHNVPDKLTKFDSFVIVCVYSKYHGLMPRDKTTEYDNLKKKGMQMYFTTASGADFRWKKKNTRCLINVTKEEAIDFIKWSDFHFGVWYDGSVPIILYV